MAIPAMGRSTAALPELLERKSLKALIPQPLLPSLGEGEPELKAQSLPPSPKLWRGLG
jgi:hypothetical protein